MFLLHFFSKEYTYLSTDIVWRRQIDLERQNRYFWKTKMYLQKPIFYSKEQTKKIYSMKGT